MSEPEITVVYKVVDEHQGLARIAIQVGGDTFVHKKLLPEEDAHDKAVAVSQALRARMGGKTR